MSDTTLVGPKMTEMSTNVPDGIQTPPGMGLSTPIFLDPLAERKDIALAKQTCHSRAMENPR
jgi:hypothetical protein